MPRTGIGTCEDVRGLLRHRVALGLSESAELLATAPRPFVDRAALRLRAEELAGEVRRALEDLCCADVSYRPLGGSMRFPSWCAR